MSFGFSVGDFVAVGKLIVEITNSLKDVGGAKSEYQDFLRELESLRRALQQLDRLQPQGSSSASFDSIKCTALSCRRPLEEFLNKIKRYENSLGVGGKSRAWKETADKVRWALGRQQEVHKLQNYLNVHVGTINMLLSEHSLEMLTLLAEKADGNQRHVCEGLESTRGVIQQVHSMLGSLFQVISGELRTSWQSLSELIAKLCQTSQQIHSVVLEIKNSLNTIDTRWTFFQAPLQVEDALGIRFPVPSEFGYDLLVVIITHMFLDSPEVEAGNYELFRAKDKRVLVPQERLLPGTMIIMAILVSRVALTDDACPRPGCRSNQTIETQDGRRVCSECDVRFDQSQGGRKLSAITGKRKRELDDSGDDDAPPPAGSSRNGKRPEASQREKEMEQFRNMRWVAEEAEEEKEMQQVDSQRSSRDDDVRLPETESIPHPPEQPARQTPPQQERDDSVPVASSPTRVDEHPAIDEGDLAKVATQIEDTMRGEERWWFCHLHSHLNNPFIAPERCSLCNHPRCKKCTAILH